MVKDVLTNFNRLQFQKQLLEWFDQNKRTLPWRENQDPYKIWVSEIMLQQTRVDTVIPYFLRFLEKFPTTFALAKAKEEEVLKQWEGLGYYSRARNLQAAVREVVSHYGGRVPDTEEDISKLKGVGPYTAGAILSIAYNKKVPAVDGNVMRVFSRLLMIEEDIAKQKTRKAIEAIARACMDEQRPGDFNQALMELGALICTPKSPSCLLCPVQSLCRAFAEGMEDQLPIKSKKKPPKEVIMTVAILQNKNGEYLIEKRKETGLLANLWQFPSHEMDAGGKSQEEQLTKVLKEQYKVDVNVITHACNLDHIFSHLKWKLAVYTGVIHHEATQNERLKWVTKDELENYPFPVPYQKMIEQVIKS